MSTNDTVNGFIAFYDREQMIRLLRSISVDWKIVDLSPAERLEVVKEMPRWQYGKLFDYAMLNQTPWGEPWKNRNPK
jgi:hypothetical protein